MFWEVARRITPNLPGLVDERPDAEGREGAAPGSPGARADGERVDGILHQLAERLVDHPVARDGGLAGERARRRWSGSSACCRPARRRHGRRASRSRRSSSSDSGASAASRARISSATLTAFRFLDVAREQRCLREHEREQQSRAAEELEVHPCALREAVGHEQVRAAHEREERDPAPVQPPPDPVRQAQLLRHRRLDQVAARERARRPAPR